MLNNSSNLLPFIDLLPAIKQWCVKLHIKQFLLGYVFLGTRRRIHNTMNPPLRKEDYRSSSEQLTMRFKYINFWPTPCSEIVKAKSNNQTVWFCCLLFLCFNFVTSHVINKGSCILSKFFLYLKLVKIPHSNFKFWYQ